MSSIKDGTRIYGIHMVKDWIHPEDGDVQIRFDELPPALQQALTETVNFGIDRGLIKGKIYELVTGFQGRGVCLHRDFNINGRTLRSIKAMSRLGETGGFRNYFEVEGVYSVIRPTAWPIYGIEAKITTCNYDFGSAHVFAFFSRTWNASKDVLPDDDTYLKVVDPKISASLTYNAGTGLVLSTHPRGKINCPKYLIFQGQSDDREIKKLGLNPAITKLVGLEDMIKLQALITSGALNRGGIVDTFKQINALLKQIKE